MEQYETDYRSHTEAAKDRHSRSFPVQFDNVFDYQLVLDGKKFAEFVPYRVESRTPTEDGSISIEVGETAYGIVPSGEIKYIVPYMYLPTRAFVSAKANAKGIVSYYKETDLVAIFLLSIPLKAMQKFKDTKPLWKYDPEGKNPTEPLQAKAVYDSFRIVGRLSDRDYLSKYSVAYKSLFS